MANVILHQNSQFIHISNCTKMPNFANFVYYGKTRMITPTLLTTGWIWPHNPYRSTSNDRTWQFTKIVICPHQVSDWLYWHVRFPIPLHPAERALTSDWSIINLTMVVYEKLFMSKARLKSFCHRHPFKTTYEPQSELSVLPAGCCGLLTQKCWKSS